METNARAADRHRQSSSPNRIASTGGTTLAEPRIQAQLPTDLIEREQWVVWRYEMRAGKQTKRLYSPHSRLPGSATDARTWSTYEKAIHVSATDGFDGIGFVFTSDDPFAGIDLDHCIDPVTGTIDPWANEIIQRLASYSEISPSGSGVKIIVRGSLPERGRRSGNIEMYDQARFFTITRHHLSGTPVSIEDRTEQLLALHAELFPAQHRSVPTTATRRTRLTLSDAELVERAHEAENGATFARLWVGDLSDYGNDASRADLALCSLLAFWTNGDGQRVDRLFRQSGLYREKWEREDYRERTIALAVETTQEGYELEEAQPTFVLSRRAPSKRRRENRPRVRRRAIQGERRSITAVNTERIEPDWIVEGFAARGTMTLIGAKPGVGKSTLLLDLTLAVASDARKWLGMFSIQPGIRVLYFTERSEFEFDLQMAQVAETRSTDLSGLEGRYDIFHITDSDLTSEEAVDTLAELAEGYGLVIVDTWQSLYGRDDTRGEWVLKGYQNLRQAIADQGNALLIADHSPKDSPMRSNGIDSVATDSFRKLRLVSLAYWYRDDNDRNRVLSRVKDNLGLGDLELKITMGDLGLNAELTQGGLLSPAMKRAVDFTRITLGQRGQLRRTTLRQVGDVAGHRPRTLDRAIRWLVDQGEVHSPQRGVYELVWRNGTKPVFTHSHRDRNAPAGMPQVGSIGAVDTAQYELSQPTEIAPTSLALPYGRQHAEIEVSRQFASYLANQDNRNEPSGTQDRCIDCGAACGQGLRCSACAAKATAVRGGRGQIGI